MIILIFHRHRLLTFCLNKSLNIGDLFLDQELIAHIFYLYRFKEKYLA